MPRVRNGDGRVPGGPNANRPSRVAEGLQRLASTSDRLAIARPRRTRIAGEVEEEIETLHLSDAGERIALVETRTIHEGEIVTTPVGKWRFQHNDHLRSACVETNLDGVVISYEEYHAYGTTAYSAHTSALEERAKRYRYSGKERDEESGLYYYGARYLAPWLGRWISPDPAGTVDGVNLYGFVRGAPSRGWDADGRQDADNQRRQTDSEVEGASFIGRAGQTMANMVDAAKGTSEIVDQLSQSHLVGGGQLIDIIHADYVPVSESLLGALMRWTVAEGTGSSEAAALGEAYEDLRRKSLSLLESDRSLEQSIVNSIRTITASDGGTDGSASAASACLLSSFGSIVDIPTGRSHRPRLVDRRLTLPVRKAPNPAPVDPLDEQQQLPRVEHDLRDSLHVVRQPQPATLDALVPATEHACRWQASAGR